MNLSEPLIPPAQPSRSFIGKRRLGNVLSTTIFTLASLLGLMAFASPFFMPLQQGARTANNSPAYLAGLIVLCLAALMAEAGFVPVDDVALFTDKWFVIYKRR